MLAHACASHGGVFAGKGGHFVCPDGTIHRTDVTCRVCALSVSFCGQQFYGRLNLLPRHPVYGLDLLTDAGETRYARVHSTFSRGGLYSAV